MNNDKFRSNIIAAYCRAREEGFEGTAEALLNVLTMNLREQESHRPCFDDLTSPPIPQPISRLH